MEQIFCIAILSILILNLQYPVNVLAADNATEWNVEHVTGEFLYSDPPKPDQVFNFYYRAINGIIESITIEQEEGYTAKVHSTGQGIFELRVPKNYPITNVPLGARPFTDVMVDDLSIKPREYMFVATECFFEYSIPFSGDTTVHVGIPQYTETIPWHGKRVPFHCLEETIYNFTMTERPRALEQIRTGTMPEDVICDDRSTLVIKREGNSAACVFPESASKLVLLGWAENPLSEFFTPNVTDDQRNRIFYDMMNHPKLKEWSPTGWTFSMIVGSFGSLEENIRRVTVELYLPPNGGDPKVECEYGWYAELTINTNTEALQVEDAIYPEPDNCTKQFQILGPLGVAS